MKSYKTHRFAALLVQLAPAPLFADQAHTTASILEVEAVPVFIFALLFLVGIFLLFRSLRRALDEKTARFEENRKRLQVLSDHLPHIILFRLEYHPDKGYAFTDMSKGCNTLLGISRKRFMRDAKLALDHLYEEDLPLLQTIDRQIKKSMDPVDLNLRMLDTEGRLKHLHVSAVLHMSQERLIWDGVVWDITEHTSAQNALAEKKHNLENLFERMDDFILICDMDGHIRHTNQSVRERLGYSEAQLSAMHVSQLYDAEHRDSVYEVIAHMHVEESVICDQMLRSRTEETISVEMRLFRSLWMDQKAIFLVARDNSHRHQTESALRESQEMLQLIMDTIPISVFWKNRDSELLGCNKAFLRECNREKADEIIGSKPDELFDPVLGTEIKQRDCLVIESNRPQLNTIMPYMRRDGQLGQIEVSALPLHNEFLEVQGTLELWRDVTEQKLSDERLNRTLEDMERFNQLMRGREKRTLELKTEINELLKELGRDSKYSTTSESFHEV